MADFLLLLLSTKKLFLDAGRLLLDFLLLILDLNGIIETCREFKQAKAKLLLDWMYLGGFRKIDFVLNIFRLFVLFREIQKATEGCCFTWSHPGYI